MSNAGLGTMNATRVDEVTASLNASLQWSIGEDGEVMAGKTLKKDLDAFLRLVYLTAAEPGTDAMAFNAARDKLVDQVGPYVRDPGYRFQVSWSSDLFGGNPRAGAMGASDVRSIDFAATREMVVGALANAADFTYVLVGDFDIETAKTLAARHIGAIPAGSVKAPQWEQPLVARSGGGQVSYTLSREDRASVRMVWAAPATWSWQREATIELLAQALNNRLLDALREDLGGTYVVSTRAAFSKTPVGQYSFIVQFDTNSARVDELVAKVRTEVAALVSGSFDPMYVRQIGAAARRELDGRSRTNEFWINRMVNALTAGMDFDIPGRARETLDFVDPQAFRTLASELLVPAHEFVYIMMPE
jgi:zinc protease